MYEIKFAHSMTERSNCGKYMVISNDIKVINVGERLNYEYIMEAYQPPVIVV